MERISRAQTVIASLDGLIKPTAADGKTSMKICDMIVLDDKFVYEKYDHALAFGTAILYGLASLGLLIVGIRYGHIVAGIISSFVFGGVTVGGIIIESRSHQNHNSGFQAECHQLIQKACQEKGFRVYKQDEEIWISWEKKN